MKLSSLLTGLVPSSSTIEGLCVRLSADDRAGRETSGAYLLQEVFECHPTFRGPRIWVGRELGRGILRVGHRVNGTRQVT